MTVRVTVRVSGSDNERYKETCTLTPIRAYIHRYKYTNIRTKTDNHAQPLAHTNANTHRHTHVLNYTQIYPNTNANKSHVYMHSITHECTHTHIPSHHLHELAHLT